MNFHVYKALGIVLLLVGIAYLIGVLFGLNHWFIVVVLALVFSFYLSQIFRLTTWLNQAKRIEQSTDEKVVELYGPLNQVAYGISKLRRRERRAKEDLVNIIQRAQKSLAALQDGVVIINEHGLLDWWNTAAEKLLALQPSVDRMSYITTLIRDPGFVQYLNARDYKLPFIIQGRQDTASIEIQITEFGVGERLMILRDVSRLLQLENMRTEFIGNVSHELKTPLTVINGYLEMLQSTEEVSSDMLSKFLQRIDGQSKRMMALVEDLMLLTKLETSEKLVSQRPIAIASLVNNACEEYDVLLSQQQTLIKELDERYRLVGKRSEIYSAIANLVVNAIKYSGDSSTIYIKWYVNDEGAIFEVSDDGVGIDPEILPRLTERFFRTEDSRNSELGGSGIGLAIVKHVLLRHDARLLINSDINQGARFTCVFPRFRVVEHKAKQKIS